MPADVKYIVLNVARVYSFKYTNNNVLIWNFEFHETQVGEQAHKWERKKKPFV